MNSSDYSPQSKLSPHWFNWNIVARMHDTAGSDKQSLNRSGVDERAVPEQVQGDDESAVDAESAVTADDIEQAYLRAMQTLEAVETEITGLAEAAESEIPSPKSAEGETALPSREQREAASPGGEVVAPSVVSTDGPVQSPHSEGKSDLPSAETAMASRSPSSSTGGSRDFELRPKVTAPQIIEAALFVGGQSLSTKKLIRLLRGEFDHNYIEETIDEFNRQYAQDGRPYEIRLEKGGYRLVLRTEFDRIRNRVFGYGPKEVGLSQDALEVLSLVAYKQPVSKQAIVEFGKQNPGGAVRQLLRCELIAVDRGDSQRSGIRYRTTPRFLEVFGLRRLDDLPQADELNLK